MLLTVVTVTSFSVPFDKYALAFAPQSTKGVSFSWQTCLSPMISISGADAVDMHIIYIGRIIATFEGPQA